MTNIVAHRGPDGDGFYFGEGVGLGHRRLSIIDLATGGQPLANEDDTVWVVFNGEIYNFAEIRTELEGLGHRFRSHTDTEVIVHAYEQWDDAAVDRFRGMFAFALWDARKRRLLLVRDRLGIKPLYYALTPHGVVFASEIKSILEDPEVPRDWSAEAIDAYLALQYVPAPDTIYKAIHKLPPGHRLVAENHRTSITRYWDLTFTGDGDPSREEEYLERLDALVTESVRLRLISDVPLGAFLSGGIDSSLVVAAMVATASGRVLTTSVGFDEHAFNELEYARTVAKHLGTESHERIVKPDVADLLPKLAWHLDEPFGDSSAVPTYYVSAAAREQVTVALSGDGGDELWAGYARHRVESWEQTARRWLGPSASRLAGRMAARAPLGLKGARSLQHLALSPAEACARKHAYGLFETGGRDGDVLGRFPGARGDRRSLRQLPDRIRGMPVAGSARPRAVRGRQDLPGRRHPHQGRQDEHGGVARSTGATARPQAARVRRDHPDITEIEGRTQQAPAAATARETHSQVDRGSPETWLRGAGR